MEQQAWNTHIDNTTLHALAERGDELNLETIGIHARQLFQIIEHLLLADTIWIADTERGKTWDTSEGLLNLLQDFDFSIGLTRGVVRKYHFTEKEHKECCSLSAPLILKSLNRLNPEDLRNCIKGLHYDFRPKHVKPTRFPELLNIPFGSEEADEFIQLGMKECMWEATATPVFQHAPLYSWLREFVSQVPDSKDLAYAQINTIFRWRINEQLAASVSRKHSLPVMHAPAFGRAVSIEKYSKVSWARNLSMLEKEIALAFSHLRADAGWNIILSEIGPNLECEFPLFSIWILLSLPVDCSREQLLETIKIKRNDERVRRIKEWLSASSLDEVKRVSEEIVKEVAASSGISRPSGSTQFKLRLVNKFPIVPGFLELQSLQEVSREVKVPSAHHILTWLRRNLLRSRISTILTGFCDDIIDTESEIKRKIYERVFNLIGK